MKCNYVIFGAILIISLITAFFDCILPKNAASSIIDCESISVVKFNSDEGQISIQVRIPEVFEYPKQNIFSFLTLNIITQYFLNQQNHFYNRESAYFYQLQNQTDNQLHDDYEKFEFESNFNSSNGFFGSKMLNSTDFIFNVYYQFYGHHYLTLKCLNTNIFKTEIDFNNITHFQPNTTIVENPSKFKNICYENEEFYAILPQTGYFPDINVGDYSFPFYITKKIKGCRFSPNSSFLFTNFRYNSWQQILFQLTPLLNLVKNSDEVRLFTVRKNEKNVKMPSIFKSRILTYSDLHVCFESLEILSEINRYEIALKPFSFNDKSYNDQSIRNFDYSNLIEEALFDQNFSITREISLKKPIIKEKIAISSDLHKYFKDIEEDFPDLEIFEISENTTCAQMVFELGDVSALIGTKISDLIGSVFLNQNAIVVDMQSYRCFCGDWMKKFASNLGLKYISFDQECDCDSFTCSDLIDWESPINIDKKEMLAIIEQLI